MADRTATLNEVLRSKDAKTIGSCSYSYDQVNDFLKQAYSIVRPPSQSLKHISLTEIPEQSHH